MPTNALRQPAHPTITDNQISLLVDTFYLKVQSNERLGPIFDQRIDGAWPVHLEKMKSFWRSVLLKTGEYKGRPVPVHASLTDITQDDFELWLMLFQETVEEIFASDARPIVIDASRRIASSLWLACAGDPFTAPPKWGETRNQLQGERK
jgi:hemoglobin